MSDPYFTPAELRAAEKSVVDSVQFPDDLIEVARGQVESRIDRWTGRVFTPRTETFVVDVVAGVAILPVVNVRSVSAVSVVVAGAADAVLDESLVSVGAGGVIRGGWGAGRLRVTVEYGMDAPPADLKAAAMRLCREVLARSKGGGLPENAISYTSTEAGWSAVLVTPGVRGAHTAIPEVNEIVNGWTFDRLGIG